jgi:hypothetical protein
MTVYALLMFTTIRTNRNTSTTDDVPLLSPTSHDTLSLAKVSTPPLTARQKAEQVEAAMTLSSQLDDDDSDSDDDFFDIKKNKQQLESKQQSSAGNVTVLCVKHVIDIVYCGFISM